MLQPEIVDLILEFFKQFPLIAFMYIVVLLMIPMKDIILPHFYGKVIDAIQFKKNLWIPFMVVIVVLVLMQCGNLLNDWMEMKMYPELQRMIRHKIMDSIMMRNDTNYSEQETGRIVTKLVRIPTSLYTYLDCWKMYLIPQLITGFIAIIYFSMFDLRLGVALFCVIVVVYYVVIHAPKWCGPLAESRDLTFHNIHEEVDDVLRNMISVYNLNQLENESKRLIVISDEYKNLNRDTVACGIKYKFYLVPMLLIYIIVFMSICYTRVKDKTLQAGKFVSMFFILMYIFEDLVGLTNQIRDMVTRVSMLNEYVKEVRIDKLKMQQLNDNEIVLKQTPSNAHFYLNNVSYKYDGGKISVLKDLTLQINYYDRMLLVGRIGSGKTSVLRLLMRYHIPQSGEIYIKGVPYSSLSSSEIRKNIGYVPQYPTLFNRTVYENIVYGHDNMTRAMVEEMLVKLNLQHLFKNLSFGLDTKVGKMGSILSGGQRQIVWIMRVILQDPECLLLDEPTASIDESTKDIVHALLKHLVSSRPRTIIIVSHDDYLMSFASRVVELKDGLIISDVDKSKSLKNT
jgi:ABC-type multidrug transport system fused ATPase/permease subunit